MPTILEKLYGRGGIPIDKLHIEPGYNPRIESAPDYMEKLLLLKEYIRNNGVPGGPFVVKVVDGKALIRDGHRRLTAMRMLAEEGHVVERVRCEQIKAGTDDIYELAIPFIYNASDHLSPLESANRVKQIMDKGLTDPAEIAKRIGRSVTNVMGLIALLEAPHAVKEMVGRKEISATFATEQMKEDPVQAPRKLREAVEKAKGEGRTKATRKYVVGAKKDGIEAIKKLIHALNNEHFEQINEYVTAEFERRGL